MPTSSAKQKSASTRHPNKGCQHWRIGSGLFVVNHNFFPAPGTEQRESNHSGNAGQYFGFGFLPALRTEQETFVIVLHFLPS